ncbi:hypothetical protein Anapl_01428 [Anas platyrhynchos]|uniref:Uncharacterized protein n=1 Tax=Anas platyrhynchos TaxID=8839 RepID=R0LFU6_ANAPL|nr:hypothetical protein Anapl_01428 [Anas platyrhynchos]
MKIGLARLSKLLREARTESRWKWTHQSWEEAQAERSGPVHTTAPRWYLLANSTVQEMQFDGQLEFELLSSSSHEICSRHYPRSCLTAHKWKTQTTSVETEMSLSLYQPSCGCTSQSMLLAVWQRQSSPHCTCNRKLHEVGLPNKPFLSTLQKPQQTTLASIMLPWQLSHTMKSMTSSENPTTSVMAASGTTRTGGPPLKITFTHKVPPQAGSATSLNYAVFLWDNCIMDDGVAPEQEKCQFYTNRECISEHEDRGTEACGKCANDKGIAAASTLISNCSKRRVKPQTRRTPLFPRGPAGSACFAKQRTIPASISEKPLALQDKFGVAATNATGQSFEGLKPPPGLLQTTSTVRPMHEFIGDIKELQSSNYHAVQGSNLEAAAHHGSRLISTTSCSPQPMAPQMSCPSDNPPQCGNTGTHLAKAV